MKPFSNYFVGDAAKNYDERNSKLNAISDCLHFLIGITLRDLPSRARVLCVGAGTGAEILSLARMYPEWTFVAQEPSLPMLEICQERITQAGFAHRCEFVHGFTQDLPREANFDAVLSVLVGHFIKLDEKPNFFQQMTDRLKSGGYLVNAEISFDLDSKEFPLMLKNWEGIQLLMGGTPESIAGIPKQFREMLAIIPPEETEKLIQKTGIHLPIRFFQAFMISACYGKKA